MLLDYAERFVEVSENLTKYRSENNLLNQNNYVKCSSIDDKKL